MLEKRLLLCLMIALSGLSLQAMEPDEDNGPNSGVMYASDEKSDNSEDQSAVVGNDVQEELHEPQGVIVQDMAGQVRSHWNQPRIRAAAGGTATIVLYLIFSGLCQYLFGVDVLPLLMAGTFGAVGWNVYPTLSAVDGQVVKQQVEAMVRDTTKAAAKELIESLPSVDKRMVRKMTGTIFRDTMQTGVEELITFVKSSQGQQFIDGIAQALILEFEKDGKIRLLINKIVYEEGIVHDILIHMNENLKQALNDLITKIIADENSPFNQALNRIFAQLHSKLFEMTNLARVELHGAVADLRAEFHEGVEELKGAVKEGVQDIHTVVDKVDKVGEKITGKRWKRMVTTAVLGGIVVITAWYGSKSLWGYVDRVLGRPSLVQESSFKSFFDKAPWFGRKKVLPRMVFASDLKDRLNGIAKATRNIRERNKAGQGNLKYRNLLLYGDPGVGKTMFARVLAQFSGMDYAIMSGASFAQFTNGEGITEMNKLIQWGRRNSNGLLIIIDEAESFLGARMQGSQVTKESYQLLTNFLHLTGERSDKIMFVFCTNRKEALDPAMKRRIDDAVELRQPGNEERAGILKLYRNEILLDPADNTEQFMQAAKTYLHDEVIDGIARKTEGLSGGELEGIINNLVSDASITEDGLISAELVDKVVQHMMDKHTSFAKVFNEAIGA